MSLFSVALLAGCGSARTVAVSDTSTQTDYKVRIQRNSSASTSDTIAAPARDLAFEVSGFAGATVGTDKSDEKTSVTQAAIVDAFVRAMVEARRNRGQTTGDFTTKIGPRVTIVHRQIGDGYEAQITLMARGVDTTFIVRDGVLKHEPHDLKLLRQVFDETNGEFALLGTTWKPVQRGCEARVACYQPAGMEGAVAGATAETSTPTP
ncbi:MAG: hypothetical protein AABZ08_08555 [Planctomycetota bacterium]